MKKKTIIVIGGLSAGPSAAAKARRENEQCEIILFEKTDAISYATCGIPYVLSGKISDREKLMVVDEELLSQRFNIKVKLNEAVIEIDSTAHTITTQKSTYQYDKLIFATGGTPFVPPIKGLLETGQWAHCKTIQDFDQLMADEVMLDKQRFMVVGGGLIGTEVAENLVGAGKEVCLVEMAPNILPGFDAKFGKMAEQVFCENGVKVIAGQYLKEIKKLGRHGFRACMGNNEEFEVDYFIVAVGVRPNTQLLLAEGAAHLRNGAVTVNEFMETSLPDIYAAGDCASIKNLITGVHDYFPMGTHSNKAGRAAGANAAGKPTLFKGAYGTAIVKLFDYTLGKTGLNAAALLNEQIPFSSTFFVAPATPGFYPDAQDLFIELYYHTETLQVLGAEVFGKKGVDKRIDVISTCIYAKLTIEDLPHIDLAYAPPYSPAKDAVITAGYIAQNQSTGKFTKISPTQLAKMIEGKDSERLKIIDVRELSELKASGTLPGALNRPLNKLRDSLPQIPAKSKIVVFCQKGLRGYVAATILANHGFTNVMNLEGGFLAWQKLGNPVEGEAVMVGSRG